MGKRLRIVMIAPFYVPFPGGQEIHTKFLVEHLKSFNLDITIITTNSHYVRSLEVNENVKIIRLKRTFEVYTNPFCIDLFPTLLKIDADIFHVQGYWSTFANIAAIVAHLRNIPLIYTSHGFQQNLYKRGILGRLFVQFYLKTLGILMFHEMQAITCNHFEDQKVLTSIGIKPEKIRIIPSGLDVMKYLKVSGQLSDKDLTDIKKKYKLNGPILFYIGRLIKRKGCHFLLKAMPMVLEHNPDVKLIIVGDGPEEKNLHQLANQLNINEHIVFTGYIPPFSLELLSLFQVADLQILPSFSESMPVSVMEGLLFGVPQMITNRHFAKWIQDNGDLLYIPINPLNVKEFSEKINQIIANDRYREQMHKKGPIFVRENYDWKILVQTIFALYQSMVKN